MPRQTAGNKFTDDDIVEWNRLRHEEGWTTTAIAKKYGATSQYVGVRTNPGAYERQKQDVKNRWKDPEFYNHNRHQQREYAAGLPKGSFNLLVLKHIYSGGICVCCNEPLDLDKDKFDVDHAVPVARGGITTVDNCNLVHFMCNATKGDMTLAEYRASTAWGQAVVHS